MTKSVGGGPGSFDLTPVCLVTLNKFKKRILIRIILKRKLGIAYYSASVSRSRPRSYFSSLPWASNHLSAAKNQTGQYLVIIPIKMLVTRTWESSYTVFRAQCSPFSICIDFRNDDFVFGMCKCIREFFIYRCEVLSFSWLKKRLLWGEVALASNTHFAVTTVKRNLVQGLWLEEKRETTYHQGAKL